MNYINDRVVIVEKERINVYANRIEAIKVSDKNLIHFDSKGQNAGKYFNDTIIGSYYKNDVVKKL